jgi:hypothetical protein
VPHDSSAGRMELVGLQREMWRPDRRVYFIVWGVSDVVCEEGYAGPVTEGAADSAASAGSNVGGGQKAGKTGGW